MLFSLLGSQLIYPTKTPDITLHPNPVQLYLSVNSFQPGFDVIVIDGRAKNNQITSNYENGKQFQLYERAIVQVYEDSVLTLNTPYTVTTNLSSTPFNTEIDILGLSTPVAVAAAPTGTVLSWAGTTMTYVVGYKFIGQTQLITQNGLNDCAVINEVYTITL